MGSYIQKARAGQQYSAQGKATNKGKKNNFEKREGKAFMGGKDKQRPRALVAERRISGL